MILPQTTAILYECLYQLGFLKVLPPWGVRKVRKGARVWQRYVVGKQYNVKLTVVLFLVFGCEVR